MRVLIAPDSFTGSLTAAEAAAAMTAGWRSERPADELDVAPMSDGGPGFAELMSNVPGARIERVTVCGPIHQRVLVDVVHVGSTAYIESAQCCGLSLVPEIERDPRRTTTYGVGEAIVAAIAGGATDVIVGLGGSGTTDCGAGALAALGARARDARGEPVPLDRGGGRLEEVAHLDLRDVSERLAGIRLVIATDVDAPLLGPSGAARGFAPQKGADPTAVEHLERSLAAFARAAGPAAPPSDRPGAGAAGGLGFGLQVAGAERCPGVETIAAAIHLRDRIHRADLVLTGEGSFDWQSLRGKVVAGVAALARDAAVPVVIIAGRVSIADDEALGEWGIVRTVAVTTSTAMPTQPWQALAEATASVAAGWSEPLTL